jgi:hypothetical protein
MRGISFERFSRSQEAIEGAVEGRRKKEKERKLKAKQVKASGVSKTYQASEEEMAGLKSARPKKGTIDSGRPKTKKELLDIEEDITQAEVKKAHRQKKHDTWDDTGERRGHRRGYKPPKPRQMAKEKSDLDEAA